MFRKNVEYTRDLIWQWIYSNMDQFHCTECLRQLKIAMVLWSKIPVPGADPLLCLLYEIDTPQDHIPPNQLQNIPAVWRYRTQITMDHLRREFDSKISTDKKGKSRHPVLKLFLQEVSITYILDTV